LPRLGGPIYLVSERPEGPIAMSGERASRTQKDPGGSTAVRPAVVL